MKKIDLLILLIIFSYLLLLFFDNKDILLHFLITIFNERSLKSIPLNKKLINKVHEILNKINTKKFTFIDFGSGYGNILKEFHYYFPKLIGIELESNSYNESKKILKYYENIILINDSMENFKFPNENIIFYIYEPLYFLFDCKKVNEIYEKVIYNLNQSNINNNNNNEVRCNKIYIIYIKENNISRLLKNCEQKDKLFSKYNFLLTDIYYENLFPFEREMEIYEYNNIPL